MLTYRQPPSTPTSRESASRPFTHNIIQEDKALGAVRQ